MNWKLWIRFPHEVSHVFLSFVKLCIQFFLTQLKYFLLNLIFSSLYWNFFFHTTYIFSTPPPPPPPPEVFLKKKLKLFQIKIFFDDDFKESV